jgi:V/A-type H+-transporting ATPase subunit G/H
MKEAAQTTVADSKVSKIIKSLADLENDIDSLNVKVAEIKKSLNSQTLKEIDSLKEQVTQMAIKEAESIIAETKSKAQAQSKKIASDGAAKLEKLKSTIDAKFDTAVDSVVSTILKP